jgi:hypothetical protein
MFTGVPDGGAVATLAGDLVHHMSKLPRNLIIV